MQDLTDIKIFLASLLRPIIYEAIDEKMGRVPAPAGTDEIGGIALAKQITGLSNPRIYTLVSERKIPHSKRGNRLFFSKGALLAWIAEGNREVATIDDEADSLPFGPAKKKKGGVA